MKRFFKKTFGGTESQFFDMLETKLESEEKSFVVTANPETFMFGVRDENFRNLLLDEKTTIVPDGIGIVKAMKWLGLPVKERVTGVQVTEKLFELGNKHGSRLCVLGAKQNILDDLKEKIEKEYPNLQIMSLINGYVDNKSKALQEMSTISPDIVVVALGVPAQETLIYENIGYFKKGIFVGVGGSLDVISGNKKRAPKVFINLNLEWLYRILKEPKRIRRFLKGNVKYVILVLKLITMDKFGGKND